MMASSSPAPCVLRPSSSSRRCDLHSPMRLGSTNDAEYAHVSAVERVTLPGTRRTKEVKLGKASRIIRPNNFATCASSFARKIIARARALRLRSASCFSSFSLFKRPITIVSGWRFASLNFPARGRFVRLSLCFVVEFRLLWSVWAYGSWSEPEHLWRPSVPRPRIVFCWLFAPNRFIRRIPTEAHLPRPSFNSITGLVVTWVVTFLLTVAAASTQAP